MLSVSKKNFQDGENLLFPMFKIGTCSMMHLQDKSLPFHQLKMETCNITHTLLLLFPRTHRVLRIYLLLINLIRTKNVI